MQKWGGAVADSFSLQGKSSSSEFLKLYWANSACLFDLWQLDFCGTEHNPTICLHTQDADIHSAWQDFANRVFTPVPLTTENTAELFHCATFFFPLQVMHI